MTVELVHQRMNELADALGTADDDVAGGQSRVTVANRLTGLARQVLVATREHGEQLGAPSGGHEIVDPVVIERYREQAPHDTGETT